MKQLLFSLLTISLFFAACSDHAKPIVSSAPQKDSVTTNDKEARNKQIALQSEEQLAKGDVDAALKDAAPNCIDYGDGTMKPIEGADSIRAGLKMWFTMVKDYKGDNLKAFADGDYVLVTGDWSGTFTKDIMGMKTTGKSFKAPDVDIFKFDDNGKMTEHRSVQSFSTLLTQATQNKK